MYPFHVDLQTKLQLALDRARQAQTPDWMTLDPSTARPVSIVICSINDERFNYAASTYKRLFANVPHEVIRIPDAKSLCEGYNRGIASATGEVILFSHDDVDIVSDDFAARLLRHMATYDLVGIAGTTELVGPSWAAQGAHGQVGYPHGSHVNVNAWQMTGAATPGAQALDGVMFAATRKVTAIGFDETFDGWHLYDIDFTYRAHLAGFRCAIVHDLMVIHFSGGNPGEDWIRYARHFAAKHGLVGGGRSESSAIAVGSREEWRKLTAELTR